MNAIFLPLRVLHVLCAALWLGASAALGLFVMPAVARLGKTPDASKFLSALMRTGLAAFMASVGGLTVLSGLYLYWHLTGGFDPTLSKSASAITFGSGGVLGIIAGILGGRLGGSMRKLEALSETLVLTTDASARTRLEGEVDQLRASATTHGQIVFGLLIVTIILMALGHYV